MDDMRDLVGAYALGALDAEERERFEHYLATHPEVMAEVREFEAGAALLADDVATTPPARLRTSILGAIEGVAQERVGEVVSLDARRRRWQPIVGAIAAVLILVVGVMAGTGLFGGDRIDDVLAAPDAQSIELVGEGLAATFTYSLGEKAGVFTTASFPAVADTETYQLWLIGAAGPVSAGVFTPAEDGAATILVTGDIAAGVVLGLTVEPEGGSAAPTGDVLLAAPIT